MTSVVETSVSDRDRCPWPGTDPLYIRYHDKEWGVPKTEDRPLFEKLILEGFQSGLSWITILRKRDAFRSAFADFDAEKIARYDDAKISSLLSDTNIIRHRGKIVAAIKNAQIYLKLRQTKNLSQFLWDYFDGKPVQNNFADMKDVPPQTPLSVQISKDLKKLGFTFVGPVTVYSLMQGCGMVNDHLVSCHRHEEVAKMGQTVFGTI